MDQKLYQAILDRKAIRQYQKTPITVEQFTAIQNLTKNIKPIDQKNKIEFKLMNSKDQEDIVSNMGGYGRILDAPHFAIPNITKSAKAIIELGFQTQQWVNLITKENINSCYIGAIHRGTEGIHNKLEISDDKEIAVAVIFGNRKKIKQNEKDSPRKPLHQIFYQVDADSNNLEQDPNWQKILTAARRAPSAGNAQPWRMILLENELTIYADPQAYIPLLRNVGKSYALHDVGILMANIMQACHSLDMQATWEIFSTANEQSLSFGKWTPISKVKITT